MYDTTIPLHRQGINERICYICGGLIEFVIDENSKVGDYTETICDGGYCNECCNYLREEYEKETGDKLK